MPEVFKSLSYVSLKSEWCKRYLHVRIFIEKVPYIKFYQSMSMGSKDIWLLKTPFMYFSSPSNELQFKFITVPNKNAMRTYP